MTPRIACRCALAAAIVAIGLSVSAETMPHNLEQSICGIKEPLIFWLWSRAAGSADPARVRGMANVEDVSIATRDDRTLRGYKLVSTAPAAQRGYLLIVQGNAMLADQIITDWLPRCGEKLTELRGGPDGRDPLHNLSGEEPHSHGDPEALMERRELSMLFQLLGDLLHDTKQVGEREATELSERVAGRWAELRAALELEDDERLVLRLLYQEGKTVAQAARDLGEREHTVMRRRNRVLKRIRDVFEHLGVSAEDIRGLVAG